MTSLESFYRGVCVDNKDPQGLGRIRVEVPQVLGAGASGWAFPGWPMGDLAIWPEDRLPRPGQGVLVVFEHPDRMLWIAAFGPQEESLQRFDEVLDPDSGLPVAYETAMAWTLPVLPQAVAATITGTITCPSGLPQPLPVILFEKSSDRSSWSEEAQTTAGADGAWSFQYSRPGTEDGWWYRARYEGSYPFWPSQTAEVQNTATDSPTALVWTGTSPALEWQGTSVLSGTLKSGSIGVPGLTVAVYQQIGAGAWSRTASTATTDATGAWRTSWTWQAEWTSGARLKVVFEGYGLYDASESAVQQLAAVSLPTAVAWTAFPSAPVLNASYPLSGTLTATPSKYGLPSGATVDIQRKVPAAAASWTAAADRVQVAADGTWSRSIVFDANDAAYRAVFNGSGVWQASASAARTVFISLATTTTAPVVPALVYGSSFTANGYVRDSNGAGVATGTVQLWWRRTTGSTSTAWAQVPGSSAAPSSNGAYVLSHPTLGVLGPVEYRAQYSGGGNGYYRASTSASATSSVGLGIVSSLTKGAVTTTTAAISWAAVPGASSYEVTRNGTVVSTPTTASATLSLPAAMTDYTFAVRAKGADSAGAVVYGPWSTTVKCNSGRTATVKSGSFGYETRPTGTATYRPSDGWGYNGDDVVQGYYSVSSNNAFGVMTYNGAAFRSWVTSNYGSDVLANLAWNSAQVAMYRKAGSGSASSISLWWYVTGSTAGSGGQPSIAGGASAGSLTPGTSAWISLIYPHWAGHVLLNENLGGNSGVYTVNSFALYRPNTAEYAKFGGMSDYSNACNLSVVCSWNFTSVAAVSPKWY